MFWCWHRKRPACSTTINSGRNNVRVAHRQELIPILEDALSPGTASHWQDRLTDAGVPAGHVSGPNTEHLTLVTATYRACS